MAGRDSRRGPWWDLPVIGSSSYSISSSSSGTVSTAYTSSRYSRLSSISMEAAKHFEYDDVLLEETEEEDPVEIEQHNSESDEKKKRYREEISKKKKAEHIRSLVQEFNGANCRINGAGDIRVLERWFTELGVGWVLRVADGASAGEVDHTSAARSWIKALTQIVETFLFTRSLFRDGVSVGLPRICEDEFQFARFFQEAMFKMLASVDFIVDPNNPNTTIGLYISNGVPALYGKLSTLLDVREALSKAVPNLQPHWPASAEVERIEGEMVSLLSAKKGKAGEAIWSAMEEISTRILEPMESDDDSWGTQTPQGSSGIHEATRSVITYIRFLKANSYSIVDPNVSVAATVQMIISCLEEKLAQNSQSFPDQSLGFLFLINNSYFICEEIHTVSAYAKIEDYIQSYLQVSWAPVLSCLSYARYLFYGRSSTLSKFESKFQKTCSNQKLWKVPDPMLRKRLRKAIVKSVAPGYTKYLEDNNVTTSRITPHELEEMLQELFEG